jgi:tetratricopeptide (TPR) repeat protein
MSAKRRKKQAFAGGGPNNPSVTPARALAGFKSSWMKQDWLQALSYYRNWLNKAGRPRDPEIEAELLLRCAEDRWRAQKPEAALKFLNELQGKFPNERRACFYKGIILARTKKLSEALEIFQNLGDGLHAAVVETLLARKEPLPQSPGGGPRFPEPEILKAWQAVAAGRDVASDEPALKNLIAAFKKHAGGEDPEPELALLRKNSGCEGPADLLLLLSSVARRRKIKIRNLLSNNPLFIREGNGDELLAAHLAALLREEDYPEFFLVLDMLGPAADRLPDITRRRDQAHFSVALREIAYNRFEAALDHFRNIKQTTLPVLHNTALCLQKLERYREANACWTQVLSAEEKPKRTDPADSRKAYAQTCRYIAHNYLRTAEPSDAYGYFKLALSYQEDDRETLYDLGSLCAELDRHQEAFRYAQRLMDLEPRNEFHLLLYVGEAAKNNASEDIISILETLRERSSDYPPYHFALARARLDVLWRSWALKTAGIFDLERDLKKVEAPAWAPPFPRLLYLEAVLLNASDKMQAARAKINRAFEAADGHFEEYELACALYDDGLKKEAADRFLTIASCHCDLSYHLAEQTVVFFIEHDDAANARLMADFVVNKKHCQPCLVAETFIDAGRWEEALRYSLLAIKKADADLDDYFLHLLVLNELGDKEVTLAFAFEFLEKARREGNEDNVEMISDIIKEIKVKGRFRHAKT